MNSLSSRSVPSQTRPLQVLPHRVFRVVAAGQGYCVCGLVDPAEVVDRLKVPPHACVVLVATSPAPGSCRSTGRGPCTAAVLRRCPFQMRPLSAGSCSRMIHAFCMVLASRALLGTVELFLPLVRVGVLFWQRLEALHRVVYRLLPQQGRRGAIALGQRPHLLPAGQGGGRCAGSGICVQIAELVDAHQIPCVQQLSACGVGAVVTINKGMPLS